MAGSVDVPFLWQYEYGKRWITYSDRKLEAINRACHKGQKTVTLPDKDPKKRIVIHFDQMYQKNKISGWQQRIRCCIFNKKFYVWAWKDDDGDWNSFVPAVSSFLEIASITQSEARYYLKGDYKVDFNTMKEIDEETGDCFDVQRTVVEIGEMTICVKQIASAFTAYLSSKCKSELVNTAESDNEMELSVESNLQNKIHVTHVFKGGTVPVDPLCPLANKASVFSDGSVVYDAMLSCSDVERNTNKFYQMQVLQQSSDGKYFVWFHSGRIGSTGKNQLFSFDHQLNKALDAFKQKFEDKTGNNWDHRSYFVKQPGLYTPMKIDYGLLDVPIKRKRLSSNNLDPKVAKLLALISNVEQFTECIVAMEYDIAKAPLGKLSKHDIDEGYKALQKIEAVINENGLGSDLIAANNEFYTKIPHKLGMKLPVINSKEMIEEKIELLEMLSNIKTVVKFQMKDIDNPNYLDLLYNGLECEIKALSPNQEMYKIIKDYCLQTQGPTHINYKLSIINIFECCKTTENVRFTDYGNKMLLWHGSRLSNYVGILKNGLLIAPAEAPSTGYMFGKGLYFADISTKSANYCRPTVNNDKGLLLLCEVSLGKENILYSGDENAESETKRKNKHSVKALGKHEPNEVIYRSGVKIPTGKTCVVKREKKTQLLYNEYVVYNSNQVKIKYIVHIAFNF